jgi:hypothetical protein
MILFKHLFLGVQDLLLKENFMSNFRLTISMIALTIMLLLSSSAFAEVTPHEIEYAWNNGQTKQVEKLVDQALKEHPRSSEVKAWHARILIHKGDLDEAFKEIQWIQNNSNQAVKNSALFGSVTQAYADSSHKKVTAQNKAWIESQQVCNSTNVMPVEKESHSFLWIMIFLVLGILVYDFFRFRHFDL